VDKRATGRLPDLSMDDVITSDGTRRCCMSGDTRGDTSVSLRMPRSLGDNQLLPALSDDPVPAAADLTAAVGEPLPTCVNIVINARKPCQGIAGYNVNYYRFVLMTR